MTATATPPLDDPRPPTATVTPRAPRSAGDRPAAPPSPASYAPSRHEWVDVALLGGLIALGVLGFGTAYGGSRYFIAGVIGALLGIVVAHLCARTRQPLLVVTAAVVVAFFLFGGAVAVPDKALLGVFPTPGTVNALIDGLVQGWAKLLTTLPPAGTRGNLLTVPYVCGLLAGVVSVSVAVRTRRPALAVLPAVVVLALSILFGTAEPASLILQGAVFAVVAVAWVSIRRRRDRLVGTSGRSTKRVLAAAAMLLIAGLAAVQFGDSIPGAATNNRLVLRDRTEPPFDPRDLPSPLNGYRRYTDPEPMLRDSTLFTVSGVDPGDRIRLATMDTHDGVVYTFAPGAGSSGYFQRVGSSLPVVGQGRSRTITVEVGDYSDVWLPSIGHLRSIEFVDDDGELTDAFRYNLGTGSAAIQTLLSRGDHYRMTVVDPEPLSERAQRARAASLPRPSLYAMEGVEERAREYSAGATSAYDKISAIIQGLKRDGAFSDGQTDKGQAQSRPGHSAQRLSYMADPEGVMVGNGEQYGALAAVMGWAAGVPTRVVMGFEVPEDAPSGSFDVKGRHVAAWLEIAVEGEGWVEVPDDLLPTNTKPKEPQAPKPKPRTATPPPPPPPLPPSEEDETDPNKVDPCTEGSKPCAEPEEPGGIPTFVFYVAGGVLAPVAVVGSFTALVGGLKSRRRTRRRTQGRPTDRIAGGWREITDLASDLGAPVPPLATRREAAASIGNDAAVVLARHADGNIFGPGEPSDPAVDAYWGEVDATRHAMVADLTRFERWKALVNLASLRASRIRHRGALGARRSKRRPRSGEKTTAIGTKVAVSP